MLYIFVVLAFLASAGPAWTQQVVPRERELHLTAQAGGELRTGTYASWRRDCTSSGAPRIALRTQPAHGTVSVRPGTSTIREVREGASVNCVGTTLPGTSVFYLPTPGFHGADRFDYDVIGNTTAHDVVTVDVR